MPLSSSSTKVLKFIQQRMIGSDKAPSIQEIANQVSLSTRKVLEILRELEDGLVIKRSPYKSRSIEIISDIDLNTGELKEGLVSVPILGTAPGGSFLFAEENFESTIDIPTRLLKGLKQDIFLLRVTGNSMYPYLEDGDLALVKKQGIEETKNGDYVVAVRESISGEYEATIKEFNFTGDHIVLNPLNRKEHQPIIGDMDSIGVQGKVIGSIKFSF